MNLNPIYLSQFNVNTAKSLLDIELKMLTARLQSTENAMLSGSANLSYSKMNGLILAQKNIRLKKTYIKGLVLLYNPEFQHHLKTKKNGYDTK